MKSVQRYYRELYRRVLRTVDVPADLEAITDVDADAEVTPRRAGLTRVQVDAIWDATQGLYRSGAHPLLSLCLRKRGEIVLNRSIGYSRDDRVATVDTPVCLFSASKAVTAVLIHLLAEQGEVDLLNPVSHYIPAFAARGKGSITLLQLLTHRGGVPTVPEGIDPDLLYDHEAALDLICDAEPVDHQGRIQAYHAITSGFIFNELIRVTTGRNAQQFLDKYISKPMGMRYFRFGLTQRDQSRAATNVTTGLDSALVNQALAGVLGAHPDTAVEMSNDPNFYDAIIPSANLYATAEEVSRFYQMLLNHGEWQGQQILDPLTVHRATRSLGGSVLDRSLMMPMRYSAGFMLGGSPIGIYGKSSEYAYGHVGFANIVCWADPTRDIAVSIMNTGKLVFGSHLLSLPMLLATITNECEPCVDMAGDVPVYCRPEKAG